MIKWCEGLILSVKKKIEEIDAKYVQCTKNNSFNSFFILGS